MNDERSQKRKYKTSDAFSKKKEKKKEKKKKEGKEPSLTERMQVLPVEGPTLT
jgi:hypothetical protein